MAFYLIGTGLDKNTITADALEILKTCDEIYLETYTVNFPYDIKELEVELNKLTKLAEQDIKIPSGGWATREKTSDREKGGSFNSPKKLKLQPLKRPQVEDESILKNAKTKNIALLVYGDALSATTHMQLIIACKKQKIPFKIFHNSSILIAIAETGLQSYKFGKTASMPNWSEHKNKPTSFINYIKENQSINAHTLLLTDIGLELKDAINQLQQAAQEYTKTFSLRSANVSEQPVNTRATARQLFPEKIIALSNAGTKKQKIFYDTPEKLKDKKVSMPFCLIIPADLHFLEEEALEELKE